MQELDTPLSARIASFDAVDRVGRLVLEDGEELRFGASACVDLVPSVGAHVFVTAIAPHPLGGRKAAKVRLTAITEAQVRADAEERASVEASEQARQRDERRETVRITTTPEAIVSRVKASVLPDEHYDADTALLYELVDDLELVGPSIEHVQPILRGMAESHPLAHFGSPGPLVHYVEQFEHRGYEEALFEAARAIPTAHFLWMLARCVNAEDERSRPALEIIESYARDASVPEPLRREAAEIAARSDVS